MSKLNHELKMKMKRIEPKLFEHEKILIKIKAMEELEDNDPSRTYRKLFVNFGLGGIVGIIIGIIGFIYLIFNFLLILIFIAGCFFFIGFLGLVRIEYNQKYKSFFITSQRIIKFIEKDLFTHMSRQTEIKFNNLSHVIFWDDAIEIVQRKKSGKKYYNGNETEVINKFILARMFVLQLNISQNSDLWNKVAALLKEKIPLVQHPKIDFLFLSM